MNKSSSDCSMNWPSQNKEREDMETTTHRKRLALILRYIASMHHSESCNASSTASSISFLREYRSSDTIESLVATDFFQENVIDVDTTTVEQVLFTMSNFRQLVEDESDSALSLFPVPPFSFYASSSFPSHSSSSIFSKREERTCWLRLTRLTPETKPNISNQIQNYLLQWAESSGINDYTTLLTLKKLQAAPRHNIIPETQSFLRKYKKYLRREKVRRALEPIYNRLFEWMQCENEEELIWGFGNARMVREGRVVNGPLLEVRMEVELAGDGALVLRPRGHTGVSLNREVVTFLSAESSSSVLSDLYRTVSEMETSQITPGQPNTYSNILKRIAYELSSGGKFQHYSDTIDGVGTLIVNDSWCLYKRDKPRTLWARDASALEERLLKDEVCIPKAVYALTHGPGYFADSVERDVSNHVKTSVFNSLKSVVFGKPKDECSMRPKPLFPLPTSDVQTQIADLMLNKHYPAVVCEGPPGTGKTHTIANILCAYLCTGKRVLITSKGSPALSVLRSRLPQSLQDLCVDVSMSETAGMRQLQQTVEQLADTISRVSTEVELEKVTSIQQRIDSFQLELGEIEEKLGFYSERRRKIILSREGEKLVEIALGLLVDAPWLLQSLSSWTISDVKTLYQRVDSLSLKEDDTLYLVSNYSSPPDDALINKVAIEAGETLSYMKSTACSAFSSIPLLGSLISKDDEELTDRKNNIKVMGRHPRDKHDWRLVLRALRHDQAIHAFCNEVESYNWPIDKMFETYKEKQRLKVSFLPHLNQILRVKEFKSKLNLEENEIAEIAVLDRRRSKLTDMMQQSSEELVEATIITKLSQMFSPEAQSALVKFSQLAGKAKFNKSNQKMSARQKRHRQEYLTCFEQCVRYIPCWILTSSQINDYLPAEFGLFDLVVIDEASQSDVTVLPGMLRGKQWLIVGDGKQVSPGEAFISENQINSLRAALPSSPLEDSLLPGHSFFDLSAQCFPRGRVVLREHFRCAPEIIRFSNEQFYASRLVPLRLPTSTEQMTPSVMDVRVQGVKSGKVNETECDTIVSMIQEMVRQFPGRSIGIISLVGNEQSRLIRTRLLNSIGPQKYKEHNILVGDPPTFQGAERDCIFLSMVCSPGSVPTQSQLMHAQRANVALSRARDRMVLVRSIDVIHIANADDVKIPIIEFFTEDDTSRAVQNSRGQKGTFSFRLQMKKMLESRLQAQGFVVRQMGVVLEDAISVESEESGSRAAICLVSAGESNQEWLSMLNQQKSIERVGWNCMRVDALNCLLDFEISFESIMKFLASAGVEPAKNNFPIEEDNLAVQNIVVVENHEESANDEVSQLDSIYVVSGDEEEESTQPVFIKTESIETETSMPQQLGDEVDLEFLRRRQDSSSLGKCTNRSSRRGNRNSFRRSDTYSKQDCSSLGSFNNKSSKRDNQKSSRESDTYSSDGWEDESNVTLTSSKRRRKYRRLDKYARDPRYFPGPDARNNRDEDDIDHIIL